MKSKWAFIIVALCLVTLAVGPGQAQGPEPPDQGTEPQGEVGIQAALGTAFTYQGQLKSGGSPVNGNCDLQFSLWDAASGGTQVGATQTKTNVAVSDGLFTTSLDFGSVFTGDARWLAIAVRCPAGSGSYTNLSPRQALTAAPYALGLRPGAHIQGSVGFDSVVKVDNTSTMGVGVWGISAGGWGVYGYATGTSSIDSGVWGESTSPQGRGVSGYATATTGANYGVYGESDSPAGYAGYFRGRVHVTGNFSAGGSKSFKIDHPLDPAGRYLYHFAQEGPEVQNVYNGVVTLDANGEAVVTLPAYFSALNAGPYRYQLTAIGAPMPNLYIAEEIQGNTFTIAGGVPGKKVSWEVTAVRHDPYLRDHPTQAEVDKPAEERGTYLYPEGYGQSEEMGLDYQRNADLLERMPKSPSTWGGE